MDFQNARLPRLAPLKASFAENDVESDLKQLFIDLFDTLLAQDTFDANVLGAAHLGSSRLVSMSMTRDGLSLVDIGHGIEQRMRYLYRAWIAAHGQGRGLHFLRTYLQMQFPNAWRVQQLWHDKQRAAEYPACLRDDAGGGANFLTSRLRIRVREFPTNGIEKKISSCVSMILPARFVPMPLEFSGGNDIQPMRIGQSARMLVIYRTVGVPYKRKIRIGQSVRAYIICSTFSFQE